MQKNNNNVPKIGFIFMKNNKGQLVLVRFIEDGRGCVSVINTIQLKFLQRIQEI